MVQIQRQAFRGDIFNPTEDGGNLEHIPDGVMVMKREGSVGNEGPWECELVMSMQEFLMRASATGGTDWLKGQGLAMKSDVDTGELILEQVTPGGHRIRVGSNRYAIIPGMTDPHKHLGQPGGVTGPLVDLENPEQGWLYQTLREGELPLHNPDRQAKDVLEWRIDQARKAGVTRMVGWPTSSAQSAIEALKIARRFNMHMQTGVVAMDREDDLVPVELRLTPQQYMREMEKFKEFARDYEEVLIHRFGISCTDTMTKMILDEARKRGLIVHTHFYESIPETRLHKLLNDRETIFKTYQRQGFFSPDLVGVVLAHSIHQERRINDAWAKANARGANISAAHCPASNDRLDSFGDKRFPAKELIERGIPFAVATDSGAGVNHSTLKEALMARIRLNGKDRDGEMQWLHRATVAGSMMMGVDPASLRMQPGNLVDCAVVGLEDPCMPSDGQSADRVAARVLQRGGNDPSAVFSTFRQGLRVK